MDEAVRGVDEEAMSILWGPLLIYHTKNIYLKTTPFTKVRRMHITLLSILAGKWCGAEEGQGGGTEGQGGGQLLRGSMVGVGANDHPSLLRSNCSSVPHPCPSAPPPCREDTSTRTYFNATRYRLSMKDCCRSSWKTCNVDIRKDQPLVAHERLRLTTFNCKNIRNCSILLDKLINTDVLAVQMSTSFIKWNQSGVYVSGKSVDFYDPTRLWWCWLLFTERNLWIPLSLIWIYMNERIKSIKLDTKQPLSFVCVYLPCNGEKESYHTFVKTIEQ